MGETVSKKAVGETPVKQGDERQIAARGDRKGLDVTLRQGS